MRATRFQPSIVCGRAKTKRSVRAGMIFVTFSRVNADISTFRFPSLADAGAALRALGFAQVGRSAVFERQMTGGKLEIKIFKRGTGAFGLCEISSIRRFWNESLTQSVIDHYKAGNFVLIYV